MLLPVPDAVGETVGVPVVVGVFEWDEPNDSDAVMEREVVADVVPLAELDPEAVIELEMVADLVPLAELDPVIV